MCADAILIYLTTNIEMLKKYQVKQIGLFGSYAKGLESPASDIDFLVEYLPGGKTYDNFIHLIDSLELAFHKQVELVTAESVTSTFLSSISKDLKYVQVNY